VRIAVVQAFDVGQDHEQRGADQVGDHRSQPVVVAECGFELLDTDGVVLVDDRHRAVFEDRQERVADVQIADAVVDVFGGEQHLGSAAAVPGECAVVGLDEKRLADGGDGLQFGEVGRAALQAEQTDAGADSAAADQHDALAHRADRVDLFGEAVDAFLIQPAVGMSQDASPHFDDDGVGCCGELLALRIGRHKVERLGQRQPNSVSAGVGKTPDVGWWLKTLASSRKLHNSSVRRVGGEVRSIYGRFRGAAAFRSSGYKSSSGLFRCSSGSVTRPPVRYDSNTAEIISTVVRPSSALHSG
jgi:hypothetical protein